jgi:prepilin-type N-terminal cleavage/methylation domain-containing protein
VNLRLAAQRNRTRRGFTLIELLVVIGIIAIMLVALIPAVNSLTKSSGRKAAIGSLVGAIEQTRANAIKTGRASYLAFATFSGASADTLDRYNYRAFAIFEDDPGNASTPKQITNWNTLPKGVALRAKPGASGSLADLQDAGSLTPAVTLTFTPDRNATAVFRCLKFNETGGLEIAAPATNVMLTVFEGRVDGAAEVVTSAKDASGEPAARESLRIARLTGRAEVVP